MSIAECLSQLILGPLTLLLDVIYGISYRLFENAGAAIIPLSFTVNFLLLPFYLRADSDSYEALDRELEAAKCRGTLSLIEVKCAIGARENLGRPTTSALENKQLFMDYLKTL